MYVLVKVLIIVSGNSFVLKYKTEISYFFHLLFYSINLFFLGIWSYDPSIACKPFLIIWCCDSN